MFSPWSQHFARNAARPDPDVTDADARLPPGWAAPLAASLAVFQLGESKGGRIATEVATAAGVDPSYVDAIRRFIDEELHHGELLAACVRGLGGELVQHNWTDTLFVGARRLAGLRLKLAVLLAAEIVGVAFYEVIAARLPAGPLRACLARLIDDETHHLRFHGDAFRGDRAFARRVWPVVAAGTAVVLVDHRRTLRTLGIPAGALIDAVRARSRGVATDLYSSKMSPLSVPVTGASATSLAASSVRVPPSISPPPPAVSVIGS